MSQVSDSSNHEPFHAGPSSEGEAGAGASSEHEQSKVSSNTVVSLLTPSSSSAPCSSSSDPATVPLVDYAYKYQNPEHLDAVCSVAAVRILSTLFMDVCKAKQAFHAHIKDMHVRFLSYCLPALFGNSSSSSSSSPNVTPLANKDMEGDGLLALRSELQILYPNWLPTKASSKWKSTVFHVLQTRITKELADIHRTQTSGASLEDGDFTEFLKTSFRKASRHCEELLKASGAYVAQRNTYISTSGAPHPGYPSYDRRLRDRKKSASEPDTDPSSSDDSSIAHASRQTKKRSLPRVSPRVRVSKRSRNTMAASRISSSDDDDDDALQASGDVNVQVPNVNQTEYSGKVRAAFNSMVTRVNEIVGDFTWNDRMTSYPADFQTWLLKTVKIVSISNPLLARKLRRDMQFLETLLEECVPLYADAGITLEISISIRVQFLLEKLVRHAFLQALDEAVLDHSVLLRTRENRTNEFNAFIHGRTATSPVGEPHSLYMTMEAKFGRTLADHDPNYILTFTRDFGFHLRALTFIRARRTLPDTDPNKVCGAVLTYDGLISHIPLVAHVEGVWAPILTSLERGEFSHILSVGDTQINASFNSALDVRLGFGGFCNSSFGTDAIANLELAEERQHITYPGLHTKKHWRDIQVLRAVRPIETNTPLLFDYKYEHTSPTPLHTLFTKYLSLEDGDRAFLTRLGITQPVPSPSNPLDKNTYPDLYILPMER